MFRSVKPRIDITGRHQFKYRWISSNCTSTSAPPPRVSRPTNPTGNVLTDDEIRQLADLAKAHGIPLIIDNATAPPSPM